MRRLDSVETEKIQLEVIECDCGFHIGLDATYLIQVCDIKIQCPACGTNIDTRKVCPENTPPEPQHGREPDKVKPLAQYLDEYIQHEVKNLRIGDVLAYHCACCMRKTFEQALDAYESTENATIRIERNVE